MFHLASLTSAPTGAQEELRKELDALKEKIQKIEERLKEVGEENLITVIETTIEASSEELRASNSLADRFSNMLRRVFNNVGVVTTDNEEEEEDGSEE